ncbi:MAG: SgcJ/EcaC family oxidoreductase [Gemmatimonadales bacterium]
MSQASMISQRRDVAAVSDLYTSLLKRWNSRDAAGFASLFHPAGSMVGFDGSPVDGVSSIAIHLADVFGHHATATYVGKVREVRLLIADAALLRAVAGMVPPGQLRLNPAVNAVQTLVARKEGDTWRIELFQSTPAAFHGRPEAVAALTEELEQELAAH